MDCVQDRGKLHAVVSTVMNFKVYKGKEGIAWPNAFICEILLASDA